VRLADGRLIDASTVVIAASPQVAARLIERGETTSLARIAKEALPVRAACLDVALKSLPKPKAIFALAIDRPLYLSVHSATAQLAPEGNALIHVAKYLAPDEAGSTEEIKRELEGLLDLVQPGWASEVIYNRFLPDLIVANAIAMAESGGTTGRPSPRVKDVPGLFIAGDWVGKEGLLADASLRSAKEAARLIVEQQAVSLAVAV
jgi:phytoene dehydrogenase-like protein